MKVVIDIDEEMYKYICKHYTGEDTACLAIKDGLVLSDNILYPLGRPQGDSISRNNLREDLRRFFPTDVIEGIEPKTLFAQIMYDIDNSPTVEELEKPYITECRNTAIEKGLPLYFVYYEETGIFEVYITETKELFEKRHCAKHLPNYKFKEIVDDYLDDYLDWKGKADMRGAEE